MKTLLALFAFSAVVAGTSLARAQDPGGPHDGHVVHGNLISAEAGFPDVSGQFTHGLGDWGDLGARASILYGVQGNPNLVKFGFGIGAPLRVQLVDGDKFAMLLRAAPGFRFYATEGESLVGFEIPVGVEAVGKVAKGVYVGGGADFVPYFYFTAGGGAILSPLVGPSFEYRLDDKLSFGLVTRFGAYIPTASGAQADFAFQTQGFFGFHL